MTYYFNLRLGNSTNILGRAGRQHRPLLRGVTWHRRRRRRGFTVPAEHTAPAQDTSEEES